jgi:hypothetical protein
LVGKGDMGEMLGELKGNNYLVLLLLVGIDLLSLVVLSFKIKVRD